MEDADPWAVVVRHGRWYLLCHSHRAGAVRAYRIDRIWSVGVCDEWFRAPDEDLDYVDLLEQHLGAGWEFETRIVFDAPWQEVARHVRPPMGRLERAGDGERCVLTGTTSNPAMYAGEWLAAIPIPFHVEGGPELRAAVAAVAERLDGRPGRARRRYRRLALPRPVHRRCRSYVNRTIEFPNQCLPDHPRPDRDSNVGPTATRLFP